MCCVQAILSHGQCNKYWISIQRSTQTCCACASPTRMPKARTHRHACQGPQQHATPTGCPKLRQAIADLHNRTHTLSASPLGADNVLVVAPSEGILLTMMARCKPGDHVVVTFPGYQSLYQLATLRGCTVDHWEPDDGHTFDLAALKALVTPATSLVVVNFPHNPTGATLTPVQLQELAAVCEAADAMLFSDEVWIVVHPDHHIPPANTFRCTSFCHTTLLSNFPPQLQSAPLPCACPA